MYKCEDCELLIEDFNDLAEDFDGSKICPHCQGDVEEVDECECGYTMAKGEKICEDCKMFVQKQFQEFLDELSEAQIEYLNELYDGQEF